MQVLLHAYFTPGLALLPPYCFFHQANQFCCMHVCTTLVPALRLAVRLLQDT